MSLRLLWLGTDWSGGGGEGLKVGGRKATEESDGAGTRVVESRAQNLLLGWVAAGGETGACDC